jgi:hypothetical protein
MSDSLLTLRAQTYGRNILHLAQQKGSKLYPHVYVKDGIEGKTFFQDRIGQWSMSTKASPNAVTPENDPVLSRRMGFIKTEHDSRLLDRSLDLQVLSDPKSEMTIAASQSIGRAIDDQILTKLIGDANYGESGASTQSLTAAQQIANGSTGLTFAKVNQTNRIFNDNDIEPEDRIFVVSPQGIEDLLGVTQATSSDYSTLKAIQSGSMDGTWMGFKWIMSTRLAVASSVRSCIAFHKYGLCYGATEQPYVEVDKRADRSYSHQVYYEVNHGAVRLEEERVVQVDILES